MLFEYFEWWHFLALFGAGLLSGAVSPVFGIGGGLLNVPILLIAFEGLLIKQIGLSNVEANPSLLGSTASATSLGVIMFTALSGSISYIREKRIDYKIALRFMIFAIPGALSGGIFSKWLVAYTVPPKFMIHTNLVDLSDRITAILAEAQGVNKDIFQIIFGATMIAIALYKMSMITRDWINKRRGILQEEKDCMELECDEEQKNRPWWKQTVFYRDFEDKRGIKFKYRAKLLPGIFIAIVGGFIGAVLGLGGGVIYVPILTMALGMPAPIATATSTFTILFATPFAVLTRSLDLFGAGAVSIQWDIVLLMAAGAVITANIIPRFLHKVKSEAILVGFWSLASFAAVRVLLKALDVIDW